MNEQMKWAEENLSPAMLRNFKNAYYQANGYMTQEAYDSHEFSMKIYRDAINSDEVKSLETAHREQMGQLEAQIKAIRAQMEELQESHDKARNQIVSDLVAISEDTAEYKAHKEKSEKVWAGIHAVRQMKIDELVAKYQKKVSA